MVTNGISTQETQSEFSSLPYQFTVIHGVETCRIMNYIMFNTNIKYFLRIGDIPYRVLRVTPQPLGKIRVGLVGVNSVVVPWHIKFESYLASSSEEYDHGLREGGTFPVQSSTGPL